ncbi:MAG: polysaccharide biosynthesis protein [Dorea formicigenerans]|nr:polysaccharide biosynthesis protein [Dorea formicigenerans]
MEKKKVNYQLLIRRVCLIILDILCIIAASFLALLTRFEFDFHQIPPEFLKVIYEYGPFIIVVTLIIFTFFHVYSSLWEYAGIEEVFSLIAACLLSAVAKIVVISFTWSTMPRSWYVLDTMYLMILIGTTRVSYRLIRLRRQNRKFPWVKRKKVMIIGGGEAGRTLITEIQNSKYLDQKVACIIDDDPKKIGRYIKGIKVVGNRDSIKKNVKRYNIQQIILTIPSVNSARIRPIVEICQDTNCELMILPGVYQLVTGEVKASKLRPVKIEDLLGRDEVHINLNEIMDYVSGKVIMVTGGGGSIGSELCRQIAEHRPKQLIIFDIYENNAYDIQQELVRKHPELDLVVLIGSVRDENRIDSIFEQYHPEIIYHAAAHKHVPLMEDSPNEAIKNNVLGTYNMVRMADKWNVKRFVQISTDKAVNPTNIMGASKRICEMIIQTYNKESNTEYVAVRFGNVLGSNGSVIPLFKKQIAEGGPVTVTHPEIIRYFMTIPEAVSLVLQAGAYAKGGEIFVLDMGDPVKILDLAKNMIRLSGYKVDQDIKIEFTGLRPGEKLFEELLMDEEGMTDTPNKLIHIGHPIDVDEVKLFHALRVLEQAAQSETDDMRLIVESIVPTYHPKLNKQTQ